MSTCAFWTLREADAADAADTWRSVKRFVDWLVPRYELSELIPPCWWQHGSFVEELTALWVSWTAAYLDEEASLDAPLAWHERFAACRTRLVEWDKLACGQRGHRDPPPADWRVDPEAFAAFVADDLARRPGQHRLALVPEGNDHAAEPPEDEPC